MRYLLLFLTALLLCSPGAAQTALPTPTLELRQQALTAFNKKLLSTAEAALYEAQKKAHEQRDPYVSANELRYIADTWFRIGKAEKAHTTFAEAMDVAVAIPTWNHRLYACIGVVEMQRATGDLEGTHANGMKALENGLLEAIAATGQAAEMGRFFAALDGLLSEAEREALRERIRALGNDTFQRKSLHALEKMKVSQ